MAKVQYQGHAKRGIQPVTQNADGVSKEEYANRWNSYIDDLSGLGWDLGESDRERLFEMVDELKDLAETASENRG